MIPPKDKLLVFLQFVLFAIFALSSRLEAPFYEKAIFKFIGFVVAFAGFVWVILALYQLNTNLTAYPSPKETGKLITSGLYRIVRHPIYSGILLLSLGVALVMNNFLMLGLFVVLALFFTYKSRYEEGLLIKKYPDYLDYRKKTGGLFPVIFR